MSIIGEIFNVIDLFSPNLKYFVIFLLFIWAALFISSITLFCLAAKETDEKTKQNLNISAIVCMVLFLLPFVLEILSKVFSQ